MTLIGITAAKRPADFAPAVRAFVRKTGIPFFATRLPLDKRPSGRSLTLDIRVVAFAVTISGSWLGRTITRTSADISPVIWIGHWNALVGVLAAWLPLDKRLSWSSLALDTRRMALSGSIATLRPGATHTAPVRRRQAFFIRVAAWLPLHERPVGGTSTASFACVTTPSLTEEVLRQHRPSGHSGKGEECNGC